MNQLTVETKRFLFATNEMKSILLDISMEDFYKQPSKEEWSVAQIASHVNEAVLNWLEDLKALQIEPGGKWGRNHEHVRRLVAVNEIVTSKLTPSLAIIQLNELDKQIIEVFNTVTEEQLESHAPSYNANFDQKTLFFLVDHLIVQHMESHLGQMVRHLQKVKDI